MSDATTPTGTEARVCQDIAARQACGVAKYGTTVAANPLELRAWLQHAYEECLDQAVYLKRTIEEMDRRNYNQISVMTLRDDPYIKAQQWPVKAHASTRILSTIKNSVDGSGPWVGIHLLDANGNFVQGGWVLSLAP